MQLVRRTADHPTDVPTTTPDDLEDHAVGLELQIIELVEQRRTAEVQQRPQRVEALQRELDSLYRELAATAEALDRAS